MSITVNPSSMVAVLYASLYTLYLMFVVTLVLCIKAIPLGTIMVNTKSSRWFLYGVPAPVYSKLMSVLQSFPFSTWSHLKFPQAFLHLGDITWCPPCIQLLNSTQVISTIPYFPWYKYYNSRPVLSSTIILQWGLVTYTLVSLGLLIMDISKKILPQFSLTGIWSLDSVAFSASLWLTHMPHRVLTSRVPVCTQGLFMLAWYVLNQCYNYDVRT